MGLKYKDPVTGEYKRYNFPIIKGEKGDKGDAGSGIHVGVEAPTDPMIALWFDPSTPVQVEQDIVNQLNNKMETIKTYYTYEMFGAIGDGIADDGECIKRTHEEANKTNTPIKAQKKTYRIESTTGIVIKTDVDWNGATFIINENKLNTFIFDVVPSVDSFERSISTRIDKTTSFIPELSDVEYCLVTFEDSNKKHWKRYGSNADTGVNQQDLTVCKFGYIESPIVWDFENITKCVVFPIDQQKLTLKNATFIATPNSNNSDKYLNNGIRIRRSNTVIDNVNHKILTGQVGQPSEGFYFFSRCANVEFKNSTVCPRPHRKNLSGTATLGTYDVGAFSVYNLTLKGINGFNLDTSVWGVMGCNFIKNFTIKQCKLNRIDCHKGLFGNTLIEDVTVGNYGILISGGGYLNIRNLTTYAPYVVDLRDDFGSLFDGNIDIVNVVHKPLTTGVSKIIRVRHAMNHDFGYECRFGRDYINVEGYHLQAVEGVKNYPLLSLDVASRQDANGGTTNCYKIARNITFKDMYINDTSASFFLLDTVMSNLFADVNFNWDVISNQSIHNRCIAIKPNINLNVENVQFVLTTQTQDFGHIFNTKSGIGFSSVEDDYMSVDNRVVPNITFSNCHNLCANVFALPSVVVVNQSHVRGAICNLSGTRSNNYFNDCTFDVYSSSEFNGGYGIRVNRGSSFFSGCVFKKPTFNGNKLVCTGASANDNLVRLCYDFLAELRPSVVEFRVYGNFTNCHFDENMAFNKLISTSWIRHDFEKLGNTSSNDRFIQNMNNTANRPTNAPLNFSFYDTTLGKFIWWNGSSWKDATGTTV